MTATATVPRPREATAATCPSWCNPALHTPNGPATCSTLTLADVVHQSDPRVWVSSYDTGSNDTPSYSVQFYRADEWVDGEVILGHTTMTVSVTGGWEWDFGDTHEAGEYVLDCGGSGDVFLTQTKGKPVHRYPVLHGYLCANDARDFARWLSDQAQEIDPHRTNGVPLQERGGT